MIQRIQTVYLIAVVILSIVFLGGDFITFKNSLDAELFVDFSGIWKSVNGGGFTLLGAQYILTGLFVLIALLSGIVIFLFRKRKLQMKLCLLLIIISIVSIALIIYYVVMITGRYQVSPVPGFRILIPLIILIFSILAYSGIRKDENLVRSYDRLR